MRLLLRFTNNQCHPQARRATGPTFVRLGFVSAGLSAMGQFCQNRIMMSQPVAQTSPLPVIRPEPGDRGMFHGRLNWKLNGIHRHLSEMA
jgi:hypothetical protein